MPERIVVLAVTKMLSGMCTAGISQSTGKWIRPVKEFGTLRLGDLTYRDRTVMQPFDIVDLPLVKPLPRPPHIEDWSCDFTRSRPTRIGQLDDRLAFLERYSEPGSINQILNPTRSLLLFEPKDIEAIFTMDNYSGKYEARLKIPEMGSRTLPVTDIQWRALGRRMIGRNEHLSLQSDEIRTQLGAKRAFVALGLGRLYEGRHWPLVVGVHTWPDYKSDIDYEDL